LSKNTLGIVAVAVVLLASHNGLAQKVTFDFDKGTDFSQPKTYAWIKGTPASNPKLDLYIMGIGDHQLEQKGLTKVEAKDADLLITYHAANNAEINATILDNDSYASSLGLPGREITIKLFRFLTVLQSPFLELPSVCIHKRNLLKARVVICSYNDHVRLLSPEPVGWIQHHQLYSGLGADIVMESISLIDPRDASKRRQNVKRSSDLP
jgi:Domain of unknown function (DUF4136)